MKSQDGNEWNEGDPTTAQDFFVAQSTDVGFEVEGMPIAEFVVDNLPFVTDNNKVWEDKFVLHIDLNSRKAIGAALGERMLTFGDTYVLLCFYLLSAHVVAHSLANWGLNPHAPHWWIRRMAVVTILYNNLGFTGARLVYDNLRDFVGAMQYPIKDAWEPDNSLRMDGPLEEDAHESPGDCVQVCFHRNILHGLSKHGQIRQLMAHSKIVDFVVKVRNFFLNTFEEYRSDFPAIDAEAMFAGTIIHSLDHTSLYDVASYQAPGREQLNKIEKLQTICFLNFDKTKYLLNVYYQ